MKTFICQIATEHDAVDHEKVLELSAMVHCIANSIELGAIDGNIRDYKGNTVGHFNIEHSS